MNSSYAMKSCVLILFVALLYAERAQGLRCYDCLGVTSAASCITITCPYPNGVCYNQDVEALVGTERVKLKSKSCHSTCPVIQNPLENVKFTTITIISSNISCCQEDLCNAAVPTGGSTWTLAGVLLFSLASVLLQALL